MQPSSASAAVRAHPVSVASNQHTKRLKLAVTVTVLATVWAYARFSEHVSQAHVPVIGRFSEPWPFVALPAAPYLRINVRAGPGPEYRVKEEIDRGTPVVGIGRAVDQAGAHWIEIADGRGYAKETVLRPAKPGVP